MSGSLFADAATTLLLRLLHTAADVESRLERAVEGASGLTLAQLWFLYHLRDGGGALPLGRVAERLCCAKSNVTQLADRLETQGLVRREPDPDDRRSVLAVITDAGLERHETGHRAHTQVAREIVSVLADDKAQLLNQLLATLEQPAVTTT